MAIASEQTINIVEKITVLLRTLNRHHIATKTAIRARKPAREYVETIASTVRIEAPLQNAFENKRRPDSSIATQMGRMMHKFNAKSFGSPNNCPTPYMRPARG